MSVEGGINRSRQLDVIERVTQCLCGWPWRNFVRARAAVRWSAAAPFM